MVSEDGNYVFMHPISDDIMYIYAVEENSLYNHPFQADILNDIKTYDRLIDPDSIDFMSDGVIAGKIAEHTDSKTIETEYAYLLIKAPYRLSDVKFVLGDKTISLFNN